MDILQVYKCVKCSKETFPQKLICNNCGSIDFIMINSEHAIVEETSIIRHMLGSKDWKPRKIGSVRTNKGVLLTVGLSDEVVSGDKIILFQKDGAILGRKE
ncbi:hypothetical protein N9560_01240 [Hyphomicrobiales bacterium]|jgi:uncharacterized protein|nr:hypothetical protein [Rhodobiaceae bacterium]MBT6223683.1 hypothetical protein [Rhodobiaceae bacterium]MDB4128062.1 hypothetical protein [Hyphomicrobiales bacterium]MDC0139358.1 hypothetical protein [Hyphomicrobiales bacterium]